MTEAPLTVDANVVDWVADSAAGVASAVVEMTEVVNVTALVASVVLFTVMVPVAAPTESVVAAPPMFSVVVVTLKTLTVVSAEISPNAPAPELESENVRSLALLKSIAMFPPGTTAPVNRFSSCVLLGTKLLKMLAGSFVPAVGCCNPSTVVVVSLTGCPPARYS